MIEVRKNKDFSEYLDTLLEKSECDELEYKSAAGGFPESFWETYSAFANTEGGIIVFGVAEKDGQFFLDKLSEKQIEKYRKDFWNNVNNKSTISCNLMKSDDLVVGNFNEFPFMVFFIPRAGREQRPVYRTQNPYNGTFKRNYEGDYKCTEKEVQRILPKPFKLENNIRKDETPAHVAVREALINFIVHADYSENASLIARVYKNRIVLSNPGTMLVSKQQYYNGGDSVCRNKALQTMFLILGSAEKAGSGVDKILKGWREQNWRSPILETKCQPDKVELTMRMESVMDENIKNLKFRK